MMEKKPNRLPAFLQDLPQRSYLLMLLAGAYLAYLGYTLFRDTISKETGSIGFLVVGILFLVLGALMAAAGLYGMSLDRDAGEKKGKET